MINKPKKSQQLINFYIFNKPNAHGDTLHEIWNFNDDVLESKHNYIQWLFPTTHRSLFNWHAPVLAREDVDVLVRNDLMKINIKKSLDVMLRFYGFELKGDYIFKSSNFKSKAAQWIKPNNHNYRRLSRILECLTIFEMYSLKRELQNTLLALASEYPCIGEATTNIWQNL